ncbi:hypothetical protein Dimus_008577 [Dionaea muscipula]
MDGNRRWAKERGLPPEMGYVTAVRTLSAIIELCVEWKIKAATCYTFSTENWGRPNEEVDFLMKLIEKTLGSKLETYMSSTNLVDEAKPERGAVPPTPPASAYVRRTPLKALVPRFPSLSARGPGGPSPSVPDSSAIT